MFVCGGITTRFFYCTAASWARTVLYMGSPHGPCFSASRLRLLRCSPSSAAASPRCACPCGRRPSAASSGSISSSGGASNAIGRILKEWAGLARRAAMMIGKWKRQLGVEGLKCAMSRSVPRKLFFTVEAPMLHSVKRGGRPDFRHPRDSVRALKAAPSDLCKQFNSAASASAPPLPPPPPAPPALPPPPPPPPRTATRRPRRRGPSPPRRPSRARR